MRIAQLQSCPVNLYKNKIAGSTLSQSYHDFFKKMFLLISIFSYYKKIKRNTLKSKGIFLIKKDFAIYKKIKRNTLKSKGIFLIEKDFAIYFKRSFIYDSKMEIHSFLIRLNYTTVTTSSWTKICILRAVQRIFGPGGNFEFGFNMFTHLFGASKKKVLISHRRANI